MFPRFFHDLQRYVAAWGAYFGDYVLRFLTFLKRYQSSWAGRLYCQRGRYARPFIHVGMAGIVVFGFTLGPVLIEDLNTPWRGTASGGKVIALATDLETSTLISLKPRSEIIEYVVQIGDTVSTIAEKFNLSIDAIRWENNLTSVKDLKPGQKLRLLPVTGIRHVVKYGDTIYTVAKKYGVNAQEIVDWPYNSFANDETFALAVGQELIVPNGQKPQEIPVVPRFYAQVPAAGTVSGTGQYVWPATGRITQNYSWYHKGIDIANPASPEIVAADSGQVIVVGWPTPWAYGNRVIIDHGGGATTLYAHMQSIAVSAGQKVSRGQTIGRMGSTGRSTGTHLHLEIRINGVGQNPLQYLK